MAQVKNLPVNTGDAGDGGSIPGSGRSLGGGNDNPLQFSWPENSMDRGAWQAIVIESQTVGHNGVTKCARVHTHIHTHTWVMKIKAKINVEDLIELESFCTAKETI